MGEVGQYMLSRHQFLKLARLAGASILVGGCGAREMSADTAPVDVDKAQFLDQSYQALDHWRTSQQIRESGELVVGVSADVKPYGHIDDLGNYTGFEVAIAHRLRWDLGVGIRFVETDPRDVAPYLAANKVDVVVCGTAVPTNEVWQATPFIAPRQALVANATQGIVSVQDLLGLDVAVCEGTHAARLVDGLQVATNLHAYESYTGAFQALKTGAASALCVDQLAARAWTLANPEFAVVIDDMGEPCPAGILVAPENEELLKYMNHLTFVLVNDGVVRGVYEKQVAPDLSGVDYSHTLLPVEQDV